MSDAYDDLGALEQKAIKEMAKIGGVYYWMKKTCKALDAKGIVAPVGNTGGYQLTEKGRAIVCPK